MSGWGVSRGGASGRRARMRVERVGMLGQEVSGRRWHAGKSRIR